MAMLKTKGFCFTISQSPTGLEAAISSQGPALRTRETAGIKQESAARQRRILATRALHFRHIKPLEMLDFLRRMAMRHQWAPALRRMGKAGRGG
jgi:hypothetical protein